MEANTIYKTLSCSKCGNEFTIEKSIRRKTCSDLCRKSKTPNEIKKISESRKKYLKENPDKHHWKNKNKFKSIPCEHLKTIFVNKGIKFIEEYTPPLTYHSYSIDIAFPDIKVGIEVNGNQHYNKDKTLADYYQERHDKIESEGWILYEIHYSKVYDSLFIEELLSKINLREQISYDFYIKKDKSEFVGPPKPNTDQIRESKIYTKLKNLKESNVDFTNKKWTKEASIILDIPSNRVRSWIRKHDPEYFNYIKEAI